ncbi:MAG: carboxypeptidase-like regulatory domain-containing protein [Bacteroidetes bacterium]|nr:carboxypeptidase-like regulatory domain-containing protein [Bacteroidota bacterium]
MRNWVLLLCLLCSLTGFSQVKDRTIVQFSGLIVNRDSNTVVPYVTITNQTGRNQFYSANYKGYFSFVAHEGDTLAFTAVGYRSETLIIPKGLTDNKYTILLKMQQESINLPGVRVFPWASTDEFKREFMTMKFADDDLEIAKKNLSRESLASMIATLPRDGAEMQSFNFQNNHNQLVNRNMNQRMANPLLNPFAWGAFIQQIMQGDRSRGQ